MQHHGAPTRLLDWSDGALMALHFAVKDKPKDETSDSIVYVLEPYELLEHIEALPEFKALNRKWKARVAKCPRNELCDDELVRSVLARPPAKTLAKNSLFLESRNGIKKEGFSNSGNHN
jgi:hypothetical protein